MGKRLLKTGMLLALTFLFFTYTKSVGRYYRPEPEGIKGEENFQDTSQKLEFFLRSNLLNVSNIVEILELQTTPENEDRVYQRLNEAADFFTEKGFLDCNILYGGPYLYLSREYYMISTFVFGDPNKETLDDYFIDVQNKDVYKKTNIDWADRIQLVYIGNLDERN